MRFLALLLLLDEVRSRIGFAGLSNFDDASLLLCFKSLWLLLDECLEDECEDEELLLVECPELDFELDDDDDDKCLEE